MEKIGINIVGVGSSSDDHSTRLYNIGSGFRGMTGKIVSRDTDSLYLGITSDRAYIVSVEGDLSLSTTTSGSFDSKIDGVTGFDIDWTQTAKQFGNGSGKIIVTNPDAPSEVSTFEVFMGEPRSVVVDFAANTGDNARVVLGNADVSVVDPAFEALLSASAEDNPYTVGLAFYDAVLDSLGNGNAYWMTLDMDVIYGDGRFPAMHSSRPNFEVGKHEYGHDLLVGSRNFSPRGDLDIVGLDAPDVVAAFVRSFEAMIGTNNNGRSDMSNDDVVFTGSSNLDALPRSGEDTFGALIGGLGLKPKAIGVVTDLTQPTDHSALVFKLSDLGEPFGLARGPVLVRATIEDLMASYGNDGDGDAAIEVKPDMRDFGQLARTRDNDVSRIAASIEAANTLGIDTSNVTSKREAALAKLSVLSDRFESGGTHQVTEAEATVINEVFGELWSIHSDLDTLVSHWHHYKQHEANHDRWEERLADRKRNFKVSEDAGDNRIATSYVTYASNPEETLAASKAAYVELFQAIQKGDLRAAHQADTRARQFSTREHLLDALVRRGKLVVVEEVSTTA